MGRFTRRYRFHIGVLRNVVQERFMNERNVVMAISSAVADLNDCVSQHVLVPGSREKVASYQRIVYTGLLRTVRYSQYLQTRYMATQCQGKPVEAAIRKKLTDTFQPTVLDVVNESYMHSVPKGSETHFKVLVVTDKFDTLPLIKRHRLVNEALQEELKTGVHALSIVAKTPAQWTESDGKISKSPPCMGGAGL